jgi:hypothetical protein
MIPAPHVVVVVMVVDVLIYLMAVKGVLVSVNQANISLNKEHTDGQERNYQVIDKN